MSVALRYAVRSDIGLLREGNEDSVYAGPHLLAIADGMGGHAAGEVASTAAIRALVPLDTDATGIDMLQALADAVTEAAAMLRQITIDDPATEGMGTTLTALLWSGEQVALCHIGDSRAYLLRDGELAQITRDHTLVQSLVDEGRLSQEAAATHPQRSLVMRALQSSSPAEPDLELREARLGDRYLLCSDGLSDVVSPDTLLKTLTDCADLDQAVQQLTDLAIRSGGPDNISCVLADVIDADAGKAAAQESITAGAAADGTGPSRDGQPPARSDSPAARAHLLTRGRKQPAAPAGRPAGNGGEAADPDDDLAPASSRRRWPLVSSLLVIMVLGIGAGGIVTWQYARDSWYVGQDGGHVALFRGVSQPVAGIRLSTVYQRTGIPLSAVPADARQVRDTITADTLRQANQIMQRIQRDYRCNLAWANVRRWSAHRPRPAARPGPSQPPRHRSSLKQPGRGTTGTRPPYPPRPPVPGFCPASPGAAG